MFVLIFEFFQNSKTSKSQKKLKNWKIQNKTKLSKNFEKIKKSRNFKIEQI
jgi:hypothetical protein